MLNTDSYVSTVAPLAKDPAVTAELARIATDQVFTALDPQPTIAAALPPKAAFLAGPITPTGSRDSSRTRRTAR